MNVFNAGIIDPSDLQKYLENRNKASVDPQVHQVAFLPDEVGLA